MHHTNIRALALALAAVLCLLLVPAAAADYEPWTYEVDDQMGSYGVDYYGDVGFNDPRAGRSTTGSTGTHSTTTSGGISTYSAEGAGSAAAVDSGLGYTTRQLPGGITLYSPTDGGVSSYTALQSDEYGIAPQIVITPENTAVSSSGTNTSRQIINNVTYNVYSVTIPTDIVLEPGKECTMDVTGNVSLRSEVTVDVQGFEDGSNTVKRQLTLEDSTRTLDYTLTRGDFKVGTSSSVPNPEAGCGWGNTISTDASTKYFRATLTAKLDDTNDYSVGGKYKDTITFVMEGHKKLFTVKYHDNLGGTTEVTNSDDYVRGGLDRLPALNDILGITAPEGKKFIGWSTWETPAAGGTNNVYENGLLFSSIEESAVRSIYISTEESAVLNLYAQWEPTAVSTIDASVFVEKSSLSRSAQTGSAGSGAYQHYELDSNNKSNYEAYPSEAAQTKITLKDVTFIGGLTYRWSLADLESHVDAATKAALEAQKDYIDSDYAARIVVADDAKSAKIYINRNLICLDMNARIYYLDDDGNAQHSTYTVMGNFGDCGEGLVIQQESNKELQNDNKKDCWSIVPYGSQITFKVKSEQNNSYELIGFVLNNGGESTAWTSSTPDADGYLTVDFEVNPKSGDKAYSIQGVFQQQPQTTLLPTQTKSVVVDLDTGTSGTDTSDTTKSTDTTDTGTTGDTTKDTDTADDSAADTADDPEQDITPDDLMISDGDEMLARMDAAFAVPYLDDPAY